jgi:hypothetical protein
LDPTPASRFQINIHTHCQFVLFPQSALRPT